MNAVIEQHVNIINEILAPERWISSLSIDVDPDKSYSRVTIRQDDPNGQPLKKLVVKLQRRNLLDRDYIKDRIKGALYGHR